VGGEPVGANVIAIDGPAGSGKSTVATAVAHKLGLARLDTGAMYRAVTYAALERGVDSHDGDRLAALARDLTIEVDDRVTLDGVDVTEAIRSAAVNDRVSAVSAHPAVRVELVARQRRWAVAHRGGVVEGRDIGTVVFTDARLKVFLTAGEGERARRRNDEADIERRDRLDSTRRASPLKPADDAVVIDTTDLSVDEVVARILERL
jgi:cytidylate kinase